MMRLPSSRLSDRGTPSSRSRSTSSSRFTLSPSASKGPAYNNFCNSGSGTQSHCNQQGEAQRAVHGRSARRKTPSFTMPGPSGDVLIVLVRQVGRKAEEGPQAIIPIKTRRFLQQDRQADPANQSEQPGHDPWQNGKDPWASWFTNSENGTSHAAPGSTVKKLDELEHQLTNQVKEAVQREIAKQPDMDVDMHNSRVDRLETSISELTSQQQRFEEWFQHAGQRHNELQGQVSSLCLTVEQQQADISQLKQEVHEQPTAIHHAVSNAMQSVQANLQTQLSSQFQMLQDSLAAFSANAEHADKKNRGE